MIMKFIPTFYQKFFILGLVSLCLISSTFSVKLSIKQTGIEQQPITINIFNNSSDFITSNEINIKLIQNTQEVLGVNKYVGYWSTSINKQNDTGNARPFISEIPNFGRLIDLKNINIDFRYILGCNFDVIEESSHFKVTFHMMSKESTSQHVYKIELLLMSEGNKIEEIRKYFENISKICESTHETTNILKSELARILKENILLRKKKHQRIITKNSFNVTDEVEVNPMLGNAAPKNTDIHIDDIDDPNIKNRLNNLQNKIKSEKENINKSEEAKKFLIKRTNEIINNLDKDNQQLSVIEPKNEEYEKNAKSANKTITESLRSIENITEHNNILNVQLNSVKLNKTTQDAKVKNLTDDYNNLKSDLNKNVDLSKEIKKKIAEIEAKANVDTDALATLEDKKKQLIHKITNVNADIKKDSDDIESNQKNLNLIQTNFNNLEEEAKKFEREIVELKNKLTPLMKKENDIQKDSDPKVISTLETQRQSVITQLTQLENTIANKKDAVISVIDPRWGQIMEKGFKEIVNKDNFDPQSYMNVFKTIPSFIWQVPSS